MHHLHSFLFMDTQATCKKFYHYCSTKGIALAKRNFSLKYDTNIPRQVGLAGSSAIVTATLKCLMAFFHVTENDIPMEIRPQFILDVEVAELCITAGLQDRVVQARSIPTVRPLRMRISMPIAKSSHRSMRAWCSWTLHRS